MNSVLKLWALLSPAQRRSAAVLACLMIVGMLLEMLSIGLVTLALTGLTGGRVPGASWLGDSWTEWLGHLTPGQLLLCGLTAVLAVFSFKAVFLLFLAWRQARFMTLLQGELARRLFSRYMNQPWAFHLQRNSAILSHHMNTVGGVAALCSAILGSLLELLTAAGILLLLVWLEPIGALSVGLMVVVATWLLDRLTRNRMIRWGQLKEHHQGAFTQHMHQGFGGTKEVKILGREQFFVNQFITHMTAYCQLSRRQSVLQHVPRLWYEVIAVASMCVLAAVLVWQNSSAEALVPTIGLFAAAAFRLLPSANRLANSLQALRFATAVIDTITQELSLPDESVGNPKTHEMVFCDEILVDRITFRYPETAANSLENVSIRIPHGASVGLVGGSGAGKSTLVDVILGLHKPVAGKVCVDGVDIAGNVRGWQSLVGYVPQTIFLCDDTLRRNIAFGVPDDEIDDQRVTKVLESAQLSSFVAGLPDGVDTMVGERGVRLSGGQRQRIGIARALYHNPQVLVLDEATSALDSATEAEVMLAVNALHGQKTLIIVAHRMTTVSKCDVVYRLEHGRVMRSGTLDQVMAS